MNALKVQSQIRDNATQMQDALRDLGSWEKAIKSKDRRVALLLLSLLGPHLVLFKADS